MNFVWDWHGEEVDPTPDMVQLGIDGIFEEADRERRPLTAEEKEEVVELYALLDSMEG